MKKAFTQTIIVFVALNLITAGFAFAQNTPDEEKQASKEALARTTLGEIQATLGEMMAKQPVAVAPPLGLTVVWHRSGGGAVLVIPAAQMKVEDLAAITEDMSVMSRIFDKKLSQARLTTGGAWSIESDLMIFGRSRSSGAIEAIYLEGYGALFLMKVNVLLSPPPETQQEKETEEEDTDPLWTETIQEMYAPPEVNRRRRTDHPEEKYDVEKVEDLKETLIKTLKHAANIRALKPDESVILTVIGKAGQPATSAIGRLSEEGKSRYIVTTTRAGTGFSSPAFLTIRAKKSDIDAFAKGQLSFDQFHQKTQLISYPFLGRNLGGQPSRFSPMR